MTLFLAVMCLLLLCVCAYLIYLLNNRDIDKNNNFIPDSVDSKYAEVKSDLKKLRESIDAVAKDIHKVID